MRQKVVNNNFAEWRAAARYYLVSGVRPDDILWSSEAPGLFEEPEPRAESPGPGGEILVPPGFVGLAKEAACHRDPEKWALMYRTAYRIVYENRRLLEIESDSDVRRLRMMQKSVRRDIHKFHAFVRFRRIRDGADIFVAWHEPQHFTVELAAPFFARRFGNMKFSVMTPKGCAHWDLEELSFSEPATSNCSPARDEAEDYWLTYYRAIYNPFRLNLKAMKAELPVRHWKTLPEAALIKELVREGEMKRKTRS